MWNYRIIKYTVEPYIFYRIAEVYYYDKGIEQQNTKVIDYLNTLESGSDYININMWTDTLNNAASGYESPEDLMYSLKLMSEARHKPILDENVLNMICNLRS